MKDWMLKFGASITELLTSKKVLTALATGFAAYVAGQRDMKILFAIIGSTLLLGQGAADFGKSAKATPPAQPSPPAPPVLARATEPTP